MFDTVCPAIEEIRSHLARVANSDSPSEALLLFQRGGEAMSRCKVVFAAPRGGSPGFSVNRTFSEGAAIRSIFNTEKVLVIDSSTVREMREGLATFPIDYSISLDTQALSYLEPYMRGDHAKLPKDMEQVFNFIAREDVWVDPIPYRKENLFNLEDQKSADRVFEKLKAYEILRTLDSECLTEKGQIRSMLSEPELAKRAQEQIAQMFRERDDRVLMASLRFAHQVMYALLLKMVAIQLKNPRAPIEQKVEQFASFLHDQLATINARELVVARKYFEVGQQLTFFGKMQKKQEKLFKLLRGMAWDFWHVRNLELAMTFRPSRGARYFFPSLLTFDKRFIEILDMYPLKSCAFMEGDSQPIPVFAGSFFEVIAGDADGAQQFQERFC